MKKAKSNKCINFGFWTQTAEKQFQALNISDKRVLPLAVENLTPKSFLDNFNSLTGTGERITHIWSLKSSGLDHL